MPRPRLSDVEQCACVRPSPYRRFRRRLGLPVTFRCLKVHSRCDRILAPPNGGPRDLRHGPVNRRQPEGPTMHTPFPVAHHGGRLGSGTDMIVR